MAAPVSERSPVSMVAIPATSAPLASASDPETAWYLRFRISERIMAYLRDMKTGPYLPKQRLVIEQAEHFNGQPQRDNGHVQHEHAAAE
jgi:hypothetical protein